MAGGRPTALTKHVSSAIIEALKSGASMSDAASAAGVDASTLRRWRRRGEAALEVRPKERTPEERTFARFCLATERASAEVVIQAHEVINNLIDIDIENASMEEQRLALKAAIWFLVHRYQEEYSPNRRREPVEPKDNRGDRVSGRDALAALLNG